MNTLPMREETLALPTDNTCKIIIRDYGYRLANPRVAILLVYGGSKDFTQYSKNWIALASRLAEDGAMAVTMDFADRGARRSMCDGRATLATRTLDVVAAFSALWQYLHSNSALQDYRIILVGHSMGGHVVAHALNYPEVRSAVSGVVLSLPAAYSLKAHNAPFGSDEWARAIKPPEAEHWRTSLAYKYIQRFEGPVLVVKSDHGCGVIPNGVIEAYATAGKGVRVTSIPGDHLILASHLRTLELAGKISGFMERIAFSRPPDLSPGVRL